MPFASGVPAKSSMETKPSPLPVTFEYRSKEGLVARVRAGHGLRLKYDEGLKEKMAKETGCALTWTY